MKTLVASSIALVLALAAPLAGCSAETADDPTATTVDNVAATVGRGTLDGYWKRADASSVVGITFDKCVGRDGLALVRLGQSTATCKTGSPDVGSYTIHGKDGAPVETGTYRIDRIMTNAKRGAIAMFITGKDQSYPLEYELLVDPSKDSTLRLYAPGSQQPSGYRAAPVSLPKSCDPANPKRVEGAAFLGDVDYNWFQHGYTAGQRGDEVPFEKVYASRPFRSGYPACDVQLMPGIADTDHMNAVCDGAYEVAVGTATQSAVWKERRTSFPRFYSISEALHVLGGDGEGFRSTIGTALGPLVDLQGKDVASCEKDLADATAKNPDTRGLSREQRISELSDNGCKIVLADTKKIVVDAAGKPTKRFVQVFERVVLASNGEANGDVCLESK